MSAEEKEGLASAILPETATLLMSDETKLKIDIHYLAGIMCDAARSMAFTTISKNGGRGYDLEELDDLIGDRLYKLLCEDPKIQKILLECISGRTLENYNFLKNSQVGKATEKFDKLAKELGIKVGGPTEIDPRQRGGVEMFE